MARYNDISHFRAPYKDSVLQGFGAYAPVAYAVQADAKGVQSFDEKSKDALLAALKTMWLPGPAPTKENKLSRDAYLAELVTGADVSGKAPLPGGATMATSFNDMAAAAHNLGFAVLVPIKLDVNKSVTDTSGPRQMVAFVKPSVVAEWAGKGKDYAVLLPAKSLFTMAHAAGAAALVLVGAALLARGKRKSFKQNRRRRHSRR